MKGNGMVAVGYAAERLPNSWFDIFDRWRSARFFFEGATQRASRIVSLAKQAVYEDISIPCDLTSAEKALVLIAGPSRELSFKGFQTVRKWIDRSIAGLEMRSGDYPVKNTKFVGIIVMLSGLNNIPRLEEIRELREVYLVEREAERRKALEEKRTELLHREAEEPAEPDVSAGVPVTGDAEEVRETDEMITVRGSAAQPKKKKPVDDDAIVIEAAKKSKKGSKEIAIPKKAERSQIDITGKAQGGNRRAPRETTLGVKDVNINAASPRSAIPEEGSVVVKTLPKSKDGIIDAEKVAVTPPRTPVKEGIINGEAIAVGVKAGNVREILENGDQVRMRDEKAGARDSALGKADRSLKQAKSQPKEVDPGKRRLKVIRQTEEPEEESPGPDDDLFWIT
jgi:hypothetical protein